MTVRIVCDNFSAPITNAKYIANIINTAREAGMEVEEKRTSTGTVLYGMFRDDSVLRLIQNSDSIKGRLYVNDVPKDSWSKHPMIRLMYGALYTLEAGGCMSRYHKGACAQVHFNRGILTSSASSYDEITPNPVVGDFIECQIMHGRINVLLEKLVMCTDEEEKKAITKELTKLSKSIVKII